MRWELQEVRIRKDSEGKKRIKMEAAPYVALGRGVYQMNLFRRKKSS